jgi:hypothetical protein
VTVTVFEVEGAQVAVPLKCALMLCVPAVRPLTVGVATPVLGLTGVVPRVVPVVRSVNVRR